MRPIGCGAHADLLVHCAALVASIDTRQLTVGGSHLVGQLVFWVAHTAGSCGRVAELAAYEKHFVALRRYFVRPSKFRPSIGIIAGVHSGTTPIH